jgi:RNA polymerase sigma factor (sigma-70 family)
MLNRAVAATMGTYEGVEDAVQEAFIAAMRHEPDDIGNLAGWLYTVALRQLRRAQRRDVVRAVLRFTRTNPSHEFDVTIERIDLVAALRSLPRRDRELLVAKYYLGLTQHEIACLFAMPRGTVSSGLSRALAALRARERAHG